MNIQLSISIPPPPAAIKTVADLLAWIQGSARLAGTVPDEIHAGRSEPGVDGRRALWIRTDDGGRPVGLFVWSNRHTRWIRQGAVGEVLTIVRTASTCALDMESKGLMGSWRLADGTAAGVPNLTGNTGFFTGSGPDWEVYSVVYSG